ncbi:hypothetical protein BY996DRAFT_8688589 [Phakopsora pachyrhizi]|nr:hypothetical protein BY996DRAFT_8688589 [Phakopsora pachyrhizi]
MNQIKVAELPLDIIRQICQHILNDANPTRPELMIDPYFRIKDSKKQNIQQNLQLESHPLVQARRSLGSLCLVSKSWNYEARRALWATEIQFGLPRMFEAIVKSVNPIGCFFDGGVEPDWLSEPPARRQSDCSSALKFASNSLADSSRMDLCSSKDCESEFFFPPKSRSRSILLKKCGQNYLLKPVDLNDAEDCLDSCSSLSSTGKYMDLKETPALFEELAQGKISNCISPISDWAGLQSLSKAFRRTSLPELVFLKNSSLSANWDPENFGDWEYVFDRQIDQDSNPAPYITCLSFSKYRAHGMRLNGIQKRTCFVTQERLLRLLKATRSCNYSATLGQAETLTRKGKLEAVGFSEYMDSAISKAVLDEILLRGGAEVGLHVSNPSIFYHEHSKKCISDQELSSIDVFRPSSMISSRERSRFSDYGLAPSTPVLSTSVDIPSTMTLLESRLAKETPVKALDLCGCISSTAQASLREFISDHGLRTPYLSLISIESYQAPCFPFITRLGLSNMSVFTEIELSNFLSGFINLIDLDLSNTQAGPIVLHTLQILKNTKYFQKNVFRKSFRSLNFAKCTGLTKDCLLGFFCGNILKEEADSLEYWDDPNYSIGELEELSLYGDSTIPTPLDQDALLLLFAHSPCFLSGKLTSLDLSSARINSNDFDIATHMPMQPNLIQFGLAVCPKVDLNTIRRLLMEKMNSVEILDITSSCEADRGVLSFPWSSPPISAGVLHRELIDPVSFFDNEGRRLTNLRVIELEDASLRTMNGGAREWKVAYGRGQRGWYVDLSVNVEIVNCVEENHSRFKRVLRQRLSAKNSNDSTSILSLEESLLMSIGKDGIIRREEIGWMSHKMEILQGGGMLARQEGIHGFHAFERK